MCALPAQAISTLLKAKSGREGRDWCQLQQLEEKLDRVSRSVDQVVEVFHFMEGEDSPRRVRSVPGAGALTPLLPAVARATAAYFVRCEWLVSRVRPW